MKFDLRKPMECPVCGPKALVTCLDNTYYHCHECESRWTIANNKLYCFHVSCYTISEKLSNS